MSASVVKCEDCGGPLSVGIQPEDGSYFVYCGAMYCSPLLLTNLVKPPLPEPKRKKKARRRK